MTNKNYFLVFILFIFSCKKYDNHLSNEKSWVYVQVGIDGDSYTDNIYGQILKSDLNDFSLNSSKSEKLFFISNVRIIGKDSIIKDISVNSNELGSYYYKINNIKYLEVLKKDPINLKTNYILE